MEITLRKISLISDPFHLIRQEMDRHSVRYYGQEAIGAGARPLHQGGSSLMNYGPGSHLRFSEYYLCVTVMRQPQQHPERVVILDK